jgi:hypothetical protein
VELLTPTWVDKNSKQRKPKGWFELWLDCKGTLMQPDPLPKRHIGSNFKKQVASSVPLQPSIPNLLEGVDLEDNFVSSVDFTSKKTKFKLDREITGKEIQTSRQTKGHNIRNAAKLIGISPGLLSQLENDSYPYTLQNSIKQKLFTYLDS